MLYNMGNWKVDTIPFYHTQFRPQMLKENSSLNQVAAKLTNFAFKNTP